MYPLTVSFTIQPPPTLKRERYQVAVKANNFAKNVESDKLYNSTVGVLVICKTTQKEFKKVQTYMLSTFFICKLFSLSLTVFHSLTLSLSLSLPPISLSRAHARPHSHLRVIRNKLKPMFEKELYGIHRINFFA